ncbi:M20/M25/M40 family metallo-hydrolase [Tumebacillus amylolyticus]|nr:M20/M25/M40 family metallo-hydrolase [Tumebacillus amylolyticus]
MSDLNIRAVMKAMLADHGVSGHEDGIARQFSEALTHFTSDIRIDKIGNLIARVDGDGPGPRPSVLLAAHMDEIGLMVTKIERGGFLRVTNVGGVDPRSQVAQEVLVHGRHGDYVGIVGSKPPHLTSQEERGKAAPLPDLFIDLGMPEEMVRENVRIGDTVTIRREPIELQYDRIAAKSLDNRASVAAVLECLAELKRLKVGVDVYAVGTVQEERGRIGAGPAAFGVNPDIAIAIDVTFGEYAGAPVDGAFPLDGGPTILFGPNSHQKITRSLTETADSLNMPYAYEYIQSDSGTDAHLLQIQREGIATGLVSIPLKNMHTSVETVCYRDIERAGKLLAHFIAGIDRAYVEGLSCYLND